LKYKSTFKEFKLEELMQDTLPIYFNYRDIEQILKIDCLSLITEELIEELGKYKIERGYKP
jgi:hypothetical protein